MFDGGKIFFEDSHGLVENVVIFLGIVDDFEECLHDVGDLIVLIIIELALFFEILNRLCAVFKGHCDQIFFIAHLCITYI